MGQQKNLSKEEETIIINAYVNEKRGQLYCAKLINTSPRVVKRVLMAPFILAIAQILKQMAHK